MSDELTRFPDGEGYMDHAWAALTETMRVDLARHTGHTSPPKRYRVTWNTHEALARRGLLVKARGWMWDVTPRGWALIEWAARTGQWPPLRRSAHAAADPTPGDCDA